MNIPKFMEHRATVSSWNEFEERLWYGDNVAAAELLGFMCLNCKELFTLANVKNWGRIPNSTVCHWKDLKTKVLDSKLEIYFCMMYI